MKKKMNEEKERIDGQINEKGEVKIDELIEKQERIKKWMKDGCIKRLKNYGRNDKWKYARKTDRWIHGRKEKIAS